MLIGETDDELAIKAVSLLSDPVLYDKIATNARKVIEKNYDWKIIVEKLEEVYRMVTNV